MVPTRRPSRSDLTLAFALGVAAAIETLIRHHGDLRLLAIDLPGALVLLCVAFRRTRPLLAMTVLTAGAAVGTLLEISLAPPQPGSVDAVVPIFALLLLAYSLGAHGSARELVLGCAAPLVLLLGIDLSEPSGYSLAGALLFFAVFIVTVPALAGRLLRVRRGWVERLHEQQRSLALGRAAEMRAAEASERVRLADQLDRSLVSGIESVLSLTRAARDAGTEGTSAIEAVEATARTLLSETRGVVVAMAGDQRPPMAVAGPTPSVVSRGPSEPVAESILPWIALAAAAVSIGLLLETPRNAGLRAPLAVAVIGCFAIAIPLVLTVIRPLLIVTVVWTAAALFTTQVAPLAPMFTPISLLFVPPFLAGALAPRRQALAGLAVSCVGVLACFGVLALPSDAAFVLAAWGAGRVLRDTSRLASELKANGEILIEQHNAQLRQTVIEERAAVARDLHDSVGHALTIVALQAGAARRGWATQRSRSLENLETIERVAASTLLELTGPVGPSGAPRLAGLAQLVGGARAAGLDVELEILGPDTALEPEAEIAAFRLVQEALTNVLKHAPGAAAKVTLRRDSSHLEVLVVNEPSGPPPAPTAEGGRGLQGMRRRVEGCGGEADWGPEPRGGFRVRARLPVLLPA